MTVIECVQAVLVADHGLAAIFPEGRIFGPDDRQEVPRPYIVHFPVTVDPVVVFQGKPPKVQWGYQISVYAASVQEGEAAALAVVDAMHGTHSVGSPVSDVIHAHFSSGAFYLGRADEENVEHFVVEFKITKSL